MARRRGRKAQARPRTARGAAQARWRARLPGLFAAALALVTLGGIAGGVRLLFDPQRFPLHTVEVTGRMQVLTPGEVEAVLAPAWQGRGFFTVDVEALRRTAESLAWVRRARVLRVWPDRLLVRIEEQVPVAHWGEGALLNAEGERFPSDGRRIGRDLPRLSGPEGTERTVLATWRAWSVRLADIGLQPVRLTLDARRAWHLELADGMRLEIGRKEAEVRLARFLAAWPKVRASASQQHPVHADLRYSNGFAVHWEKDPATGQEKT